MEALEGGHSRDAKKVPVSGAGRLGECKNIACEQAFGRVGYRGKARYFFPQTESLFTG